MAVPRSADEMNLIRRATKARQQASRKKRQEETVVSLEDIQKAKRKRAAYLRAAKANGERLLTRVDTLGAVIMTLPAYAGEDATDDFERNIRDVTAAAKRSNTRYVWERMSAMTFQIAVAR